MPAEDPDDEDAGDRTPPEDPADSAPGETAPDGTPAVPEDDTAASGDGSERSGRTEGPTQARDEGPTGSRETDADDGAEGGPETRDDGAEGRTDTGDGGAEGRTDTGDDGTGDGETGAPPVGRAGERRSRPSPAGDDEEEHNDLVAFVREVVTSVGTVLLVGVLLFAASGVWPPLVAVESGSMEPHMSKGDLVFVAENGRYAPGDAVGGVVTYQQGRETGYWSFGDYGNVVVYQPDGRARTPVIHRARIYVEAGENWVERADPEYLGSYQTCEENVHCPAEHDGFITRGDNNPRYDQVGTTDASTLSDVVKPEWIRGNAKVRLPKLGCIRLELSGIGCEYP